jgi:hypothetical protein
MKNEKNLIKLEKEIYQKIIQIKSGKLLPKDSGIGKLINLMKTLDEPTYDKLLKEYKSALSGLK